MGTDMELCWDTWNRAWGRAVCVAAISLVSGILEGAVLTVWAADGVGWGCLLIHRVTEGGKDL